MQFIGNKVTNTKMNEHINTTSDDMSKLDCKRMSADK